MAAEDYLPYGGLFPDDNFEQNDEPTRGDNRMTPLAWKPQSNETHKQWMNAIINEATDELNDWETKFIESLSAKVYNKESLSEGQEKKLEQIYARYTK